MPFKAISNSIKETDLIRHLMRKIACHDCYTAIHSYKVQRLAVDLATQLNLSPQTIQEVSTAALLHDIGKIKITKTILNKPGKLSDLEFKIIQQHSAYGYQILNCFHPLKNIAISVLHHHEKFDGTGYPNGKSEDEIPFTSRILSLSDVYEAITSERCYRKAMSQKAALKVIYEGSGIYFDPSLINAFFVMIKQSHRLR